MPPFTLRSSAQLVSHLLNRLSAKASGTSATRTGSSEPPATQQGGSSPSRAATAEQATPEPALRPPDSTGADEPAAKRYRGPQSPPPAAHAILPGPAPPDGQERPTPSDETPAKKQRSSPPPPAAPAASPTPTTPDDRERTAKRQRLGPAAPEPFSLSSTEPFVTPQGSRSSPIQELASAASTPRPFQADDLAQANFHCVCDSPKFVDGVDSPPARWTATRAANAALRYFGRTVDPSSNGDPDILVRAVASKRRRMEESNDLDPRLWAPLLSPPRTPCLSVTDSPANTMEIFRGERCTACMSCTTLPRS